MKVGSDQQGVPAFVDVERRRLMVLVMSMIFLMRLVSRFRRSPCRSGRAGRMVRGSSLGLPASRIRLMIRPLRRPYGQRSATFRRAPLPGCLCDPIYWLRSGLWLAC